LIFSGRILAIKASSRGWRDNSGSVKSRWRVWVKRAQIDAGTRPGLTTEEREELKRLRKENFELQRANDILQAAATFFGAELDADRRGSYLHRRPPGLGDPWASLGVEPICKELQVAPSTYYDTKSRPASARQVRDEEIGPASRPSGRRTTPSTDDASSLRPRNDETGLWSRPGRAAHETPRYSRGVTCEEALHHPRRQEQPARAGPRQSSVRGHSTRSTLGRRFHLLLHVEWGWSTWPSSSTCSRADSLVGKRVATMTASLVV